MPDTGSENSGSKDIVQVKNAYKPTSRGGTESKREGKQQLPVLLTTPVWGIKEAENESRKVK